jgi:cation/acetate symporter
MVAAGAFAAFMSTSSGLLVSIAGTLSYDVWPRLAPGRTTGPRGRRS